MFLSGQMRSFWKKKGYENVWYNRPFEWKQFDPLRTLSGIWYKSSHDAIMHFTPSSNKHRNIEKNDYTSVTHYTMTIAAGQAQSKLIICPILLGKHLWFGFQCQKRHVTCLPLTGIEPTCLRWIKRQLHVMSYMPTLISQKMEHVTVLDFSKFQNVTEVTL